LQSPEFTAKDTVKEFIRCQKWIENALKYSGGTHETIDIFYGIMDCRMQLWPATDGCLVTEIVAYPRKKVLHIFLAGGKLGQLKDMQEAVMEWGKQHGCSNLTLAGRKGWERALKNQGWKPILTTLSVDIL
jgi:hypothetical protein